MYYYYQIIANDQPERALSIACSNGEGSAATGFWIRPGWVLPVNPSCADSNVRDSSRLPTSLIFDFVAICKDKNSKGLHYNFNYVFRLNKNGPGETIIVDDKDFFSNFLLC